MSLANWPPKTMGDFFDPPMQCSPRSCGREEQRESIERLGRVPGYLLRSHLLSLLFQLRASVEVASKAPGSGIRRYALAIHMRRTDKLTDSRAFEKIRVWDAPTIVAQALSVLRLEQHRGPPPPVLLASDDNDFSRSVGRTLTERGANVTILLADEPMWHLRGLTSEDAHWSYIGCGVGCVASLFKLVGGFMRADHLLISTQSNLGSFLLNAWPAANADRMPTFTDMDGKLEPTQLRPDRFMCSFDRKPDRTDRGVCDRPPALRPLLRGCLPKQRLQPMQPPSNTPSTGWLPDEMLEKASSEPLCEESHMCASLNSSAACCAPAMVSA